MTGPLEDLMQEQNQCRVDLTANSLRDNGEFNALAVLLSMNGQSAKAIAIWKVYFDMLSMLSVVPLNCKGIQSRTDDTNQALYLQQAVLHDSHNPHHAISPQIRQFKSKIKVQGLL